MPEHWTPCPTVASTASPLSLCMISVLSPRPLDAVSPANRIPLIP